MTKALELAKFGRETPPTGVVVGDTDLQTLSQKTFADGPVFSGLNANGVPFLNASRVLSSSATFVFDGANLGVGVANPAAVIHANAAGGGTIRASRSSVGGEYVQLDHDGTDGTLRVSGNNKLFLTTNGTTRVTILGSGNVGIGNSNPDYPLEISSTNPNSITWQRTGVSAKKWGFTSDNSYTYLYNHTDGVLAVGFPNAGGIILPTTATAIQASDGYNILHQTSSVVTVGATNRSLRFATSASASAMTLSTTGGLSIGLTADAGAGNILLPGNSGTIFAAATTGSRSYIELYNNSTGDMSIATTYSTAGIRFLTGGTTTPTERLRINSTGDSIFSGNVRLYNYVNSGSENNRLAWDNGIYNIGSIRMIVGAGQINRGEMGFYVNNGASEQLAMNIDYGQNVKISQNLGIGAAPTAVTGFGINKFLEIGGASVPGLVLRPTGSTSEHSVLGAGDGLLIGAAGAATATNNVIRFFTSNVNSSNSSLGERMRVASNGHIGIGTTNPISNAPSTSGVLHINTVDVGGWAITHYTNGSTGAGAGDGVVIGNIGLDTYIFNYEAGDIIFGTSGSAKARITSAGVFDTPTVQTSGTPVGTFSASKWFTQTEDTTTTRTYFCGPNTTTYGSWEIYNAKSNGTPLIAAAFTADYTKFGIPSSSSEAMRITNAGNLAIGTTANTAQKLNVNGGLWLIASDYPSYSTQFLPRLDSTHPFTIQTRNNDSTMVNWLGIYSDNAGAAPRIVLGQGGWPVGIGTTAPQGLLQVGATGNALIYVNSVLTEIAPPTSGNDLYIFRSQNDGSMNFSARPGGGSAYRFWGGATQYMFINSSGNVGIGADPTVKLEVNGEIKSANININQNNNLLYFTKTGGSTGTSSNNTHFIGRVDSTGYHITGDAGGFASVADSFVIGAKGSLILGTSTPTSTYSSGRVIINQTGDVGVGTASPESKLHVVGGVIRSGTVDVGRVHTDIMAMWRTADIQGYKTHYGDGGSISYTWDNGVVLIDSSVGSHTWDIGKIRLTPGTYQLIIVYRPSPTAHGWSNFGTNSNGHRIRLQSDASYPSYNTFLAVDAYAINKDLGYSITYASGTYTVSTETTFRIGMGTDPYSGGGYKCFIEAAYLVRLN